MGDLRPTTIARVRGPPGNEGAPDAARSEGGRLPALLRSPVPWLPLLALAGCAGAAPHGAPGSPSGPDPVPEPDRVVAEFLDAANRRDLAAMASRFGTADGPIDDRGGALGCAFRKVGSWIGLGDRCVTALEVELRMDLMATILAHESHRVGGRAAVAGRGRPATRIEVELGTAAGRGVVVPFVLIRADDGSWLVEQVRLERLLG